MNNCYKTSVKIHMCIREHIYTCSHVNMVKQSVKPKSLRTKIKPDWPAKQLQGKLSLLFRDKTPGMRAFSFLLYKVCWYNTSQLSIQIFPSSQALVCVWLHPEHQNIRTEFLLASGGTKSHLALCGRAGTSSGWVLHPACFRAQCSSDLPACDTGQRACG